MKVNDGMLFNFLAICAVSHFVLLSAAGIPLSNEQKSEEIASSSSSPETTSVAAVTSKAAESSNSSSSGSSSENASVEGSTDTMPPLVFPADDAKLSPKNETALKILQKESAKSEETKSNETETKTDLSSSTQKIPAPSSTAESAVNATDTSTPKEATEDDYDSVSEEDGKADAENVQDDDAERQEGLEEDFGRNGSDKATINLFEDPVTNEPALHNGHIALIFASSLVVLSVVAYIGLILWRSRIEGRYGMSQRLVTSDDYYNNNDVRYFGL